MDSLQTGLEARGSPIPYLFLLVVDVLQSIIKQAGINIRHPLADEACSVLQYADDALLVLRADVNGVQHRKMCLNQFAQATGLKINFHKSTVVPMHVPAASIDAMVVVL